MEHSEHVEEHANQLMAKISKYMNRPLKGHFTFSQEKYNHKVMLTLKGKNIFFKAEALHENFYAAIESAIDKMHRQLQKKNGKMKHHKQKHPAKELNNVIFLEEYKRNLEMRRKIS
jgi:ribosomal subunit interface protein